MQTLHNVPNKFTKSQARLFSQALIVVSSLFIVFLLSSCDRVDIYLNCYERENSIPNVPLYPGSLLLKETKILDVDSKTIIKREYEVQEAPALITNFYRTKIECAFSIVNNILLCQGKASPYGSYSVSINYSNKTTTSYVVEVNWDKCAQGVEESIE